MPSTALDASHILDRLRINLLTAGIPATDTDFETFLQSGSIAFYEIFDHSVALLASDTLPDNLAAWGPENQSPGAQSLPVSPPAQPTSGEATTIAAIAPLIRSRKVSPVELTEQALEHIEQREPALNAFQLLLNEQARAAARRAETEIAAGNYRGPLHGVPIAIKDLLAMKGTVTTAGSKVFAGRVTDYDSAAVEKLNAAGAIIVGKTRMTEFAYSPGSENPHYGPTHNPWNLDCCTGGSSTGSAAAVTDGMVWGALGSDTGGSIRMPASFCGIVGLKPTFGRVSLYGADPLSWSLDHLGPLTRSVEDAAIFLAALAGHDPRDVRTRPHTDFVVPADLHSGVKDLRIGVLRHDGSGKALASDEVLAGWQAANAALANQGATLVEIDLPEMEPMRSISGGFLAMEAAAFHAPYMAAHIDLYGAFGRSRLVRAFMYASRDYLRAQQARQTIRQRWDAIFNQVDLISTPGQPAVAPQLVGGLASTAFTNAFNALGWPAITLPCGLSAAGLPLSIQLVARPWDEATLLRGAQAVEAAKLMPAFKSPYTSSPA